MNWKELVKRLKEKEPELAKEMQAMFEAMEEGSASAQELKEKVRDLTTRLEERESIKRAANDEAAEERHKRQALERKMKDLHSAGIVDKENNLAVKIEDLKKSAEAFKELETLREKVSGHEKAARRTVIETKVTKWHGEKKYTSGLKVLTGAVALKIEELKDDDELALAALLEGVVKDNGEEIFLAVRKDASDGKGGETKPIVTPTTVGSPHYSIDQPGKGLPVQIGVSSRRPGNVPTEAPSVAAMAARSRQQHGIPVPAAVAQLAEKNPTAVAGRTEEAAAAKA